MITKSKPVQNRVQKAIEKIRENLGQDSIDILMMYPKFPNARIVELSSMWPERAQHVLNQLNYGEPIVRAFDNHVANIYGTHDWTEICSRLWLARGKLLSALVKFYWDHRRRGFSDVDTMSLSQTENLAERILQQLVEFPLQATETGNPRRSSDTPPLDDPRKQKTRHPSASFRLGFTFLLKCARDIPRIPEKIGVAPAHFQRAIINTELAKILQAIHLFRIVESGGGGEPVRMPEGLDQFGLGPRYAPWLSSITTGHESQKSIVARVAPRPDDLIAVWMAERYGFPTCNCNVSFVPVESSGEESAEHDCCINIDVECSNAQLVFNSDANEIADQDPTCATRLVWESLVACGVDLDHLEPLVDLAHDSKVAPRQKASAAYKESATSGLLSHIKCLKELGETDKSVYNATALWLDTMYRVPVSEN